MSLSRDTTPRFSLRDDGSPSSFEYRFEHSTDVVRLHQFFKYIFLLLLLVFFSMQQLLALAYSIFKKFCQRLVVMYRFFNLAIEIDINAMSVIETLL